MSFTNSKGATKWGNKGVLCYSIHQQIFILFFVWFSMAQQQNQIQMPGAFGGLMRYDAEYSSKFAVSPKAVIAFLVAVIAFVVVLKVFWPIG